MKYFIDEVNVIVDGEQKGIISIGSSGTYNPNRVKANALETIKEYYPDSQIAAVILIHKEVTLEEYKNVIGRPSWLGNINNN